MRPFSFWKQGIPPAISSISPSQGLAGDSITITGTALSAATVTIGGNAATVTGNTSTTITVTVPAGSVGAQDVIVTTLGGSDTETGGFLYLMFRADFSALTLGGIAAAAFNTATGLTFTRSSESTCQKSASTLETAANIGNDYACIGSPDGTKKGLVIQHKTRNIFGSASDNSPRDLNIGWTGGTAGTVTSDYAAGPDGVSPGVSVKGCTRVSGASGTYGPYATSSIIATSTKVCLSSWQRSTSGSNGDMEQIFNTGSPGASSQVTSRTHDTTWARLATLKGTTAMAATTTVDCRDYSAATGGQTARARDVLVDYVQLERGEFPTEVVRKGGANRSPDVVTYGTLTNWYQSGRLRTYFAFYPKHASTVQPQADDGTNTAAVDKYYLLSKDSDNYVRIDASTMKVEAKTGSGGSSVVSTTGMTWAAQDLVEIFVEVGTSTTNIWYRVNSGSWTALMTSGTTTAAFSASGTVYVGKADTDYGTGSVNTGSLVCWLKECRFYPSTGYPAGLP